MTVVRSFLPDPMAAAVATVLADAGVEHVADHGDDPIAAGEAAASDDRTLALIGPFRSADIAEAVEATAPAGLPLLAPVATWAGVTRDDEPGCDDAARHGGTVVRLVARDTVVAARLANDLRAAGRRALVVAGEHDYGRQLDGQLRMADLPRAEHPGEADVVVVCGLAGAPEVYEAADAAPLPVIGFDGIQGANLGRARAVRVALPFAPADGDICVERARHAAELVVAALREGASDRAAVLANLRRLGPFDEHGDPIDPPVWLWRAADDWTLEPDRPL